MYGVLLNKVADFCVAARLYSFVCPAKFLSAFRLLKRGGFMPYCVKCGAPTKPDDQFCAVCGAAVPKVTREEFEVAGKDLVDRVAHLLHEGNVTRLIVKDEAGKTLLEIPATIGVLGVVVAPWLAALGVIAALVANCTLVVERRE
jgi:hypothetical protein